MKDAVVLLVDDEADIRRVGELSLERVGGFKTFLASNGNEALDRARSERPDLILLDVMMPEMDGPKVLEKLKGDDDLREIPVIFLTAKARQAEVESLLALGARGVIPKPFDPMSLPSQVAAIMGWGSS